MPKRPIYSVEVDILAIEMSKLTGLLTRKFKGRVKRRLRKSLNSVSVPGIVSC
jgi:hypothetical protein